MPCVSAAGRVSIRRAARWVAERLEHRTLLATFQFFGDNGIDNISVTRVGANINIVIDGVGSNVPDLAATRIEIFGHGSGDRINVDSNGVSTVVVDGGTGDDTISLAFDNNSDNLDGIDGPVQLIGGGNTDFLVIGDETHDTASGNVLYDLTETTFNRSSVSGTTAAITHGGFERIAMVTADSDPTQTSLANGFIPTEILAGPFADELILGATSFRLALDNRGLVTFSAGAGIDRVVINDNFETFGNDWVIDSGAPTPATTYVAMDSGDFGGLNTADVETFRIEAGSGANSFVVNTTPAPGISFDIRGNGNDDQVLLAERTGRLADLPSQVTFRGGPGSDRLKMTDIGNTAAGAYDFTLSTIDYPGFGSAVIDLVETVQLDAGDGDSSVVVRQTGTGVGTTINGFAGNDTFSIGNDDYDNFINGRITVNGNSGIDALVFEDDLDAVGDDVYGVTATTFAKTFGQPTTYGTMEALTINASDNSDTIDFFGIDPLTAVSVFAGAGNDVIRIGNGSTGQQANFKPSIAVSGEGGGDALTIHNPGSITDELFFIDSDSVLLAFPVTGSPISYASIESMLINDGSGNSSFVVNELLPTTNVTVLGNLGNDLFFNSFLSSTPDLGRIDGQVQFNGGIGTDGVDLLDTVAGNDAYALGATRVSRPGFGGLTVSAIESFSLRGQSGDNVFNIADTPPATTRLFGNGGADTFNVVATHALAGHLQIAGNAGPDVVSVNNDAVGTALVEFVENEDLASLTIGSGGRVRVATTLIDTFALSVSGLLDLGDGALIARGDAAVPGENAYRLLLRTGYAAGAWNGPEPAIGSSILTGTPVLDAIGYARAGDINASLFLNVSVAPDDLLMRRTLMGDADLNRTVNFNDLLRIARNYDNTAPGRFWSDGDFNYNGITNFDDLLAHAQNYEKSLQVSAAKSRRPVATLLDELL